MKTRFLPLILGLLFLSSCGGDTREDDVEIKTAEVVTDSISTLEGEFIFLADAAVLKGTDFIYGVQIDSASKALAEQLAPLKDDDFDLVPVVLRAKIIDNPKRDGWEEIIQIREVIEIKSDKKQEVDSLKVDLEINKP